MVSLVKIKIIKCKSTVEWELIVMIELYNVDNIYL